MGNWTLTQNTDAPVSDGLPRPTQYRDSRGTVTITPVHHGNQGLVDLRYQYTEGAEYHDWLLKNAIQLHVEVITKTQPHAFIMEHWVKKVTTIVKNRVKRHPRMHMVTDYDIRIVWNPSALDVRSTNKRPMGAMARRMVDVLTHVMDADVKKKHGTVHAELQISKHYLAAQAHCLDDLGLPSFVLERTEGLREQSREIAVGCDVDTTLARNKDLPPGFEFIPKPQDYVFVKTASACRSVVRSGEATFTNTAKAVQIYRNIPTTLASVMHQRVATAVQRAAKEEGTWEVRGKNQKEQ